MNLSKDQVKDKFKNLFLEERDLIDDIPPFSKKTSSNDDVMVFNFSFDQLSILVDSKYMDYLLEKPEEGFNAIKEVLEEEDYKTYLGYEEEDQIEVGIKDLPETHIKSVRELREEDIGKYVGVKGIVRRTSDILHLAEIITFECERCGDKTRIHQDVDNYQLKEPIECDGCGKSSNKTNFNKILSEMEFKDYQEVKIEERRRDLKAGEQPRNKKAILPPHLVDQLNSSDEVILYGIYKPRFKKNSSIPKTYLDVKDIEVLSKDFTEVDLDPEEEERVKELAENPDIFDKIVNSIAPSIKGLEEEKKSIALQLFGGVRKENENTHRGDIHILLAGDPETGKSQLLDYVSKIAPKGILGSGRGTSGVGLTASVTQEEIAGETNWVLDAGILPLADGGLAAIDEFDKMRAEDRDTIHRALEQQEINIDKSNIHQTLKTRCPVLAAANPKLGRFDRSDLNNPEKNLIEEIDIKPDLRSRFDYIWIITGDKKEEEQRELADHITKLHKDLGRSQRNPDFNPDDFTPLLSQKELRNYIKKAKEKIPIWEEDPRKKIRDFYTELNESVDIGPRTLEALIRTAEASARLHFREEITEEDINLAIQLKEEQLKRAKELDLLYTGYTETQRTRRKEVRDLILTLKDDYSKGVPEEEIIKAAKTDGFGKEEIEKELGKMKKTGDIYYPDQGRVRLG